jgi:hypothetical protein
VISCLVVGYPVALLMVYKGHFGLQGLWFGMSTAWLTASAVYGILISRTNWEGEVIKAAQRNADAEKSTQRGKAALLSLVVTGSVNGDEDEDEAGEMQEFVGNGSKGTLLVSGSTRGEE